MFKTFLSLRYLRARKTNWIGMAGIFVAVAALVMILSIMSGFLELSRLTLRGNLADLQITPGRVETIVTEEGDEVAAKKDAEGAVAIVEANQRVVAATPQLNWYGLMMPDDRERPFENPLEDAIELVQLVGVDVESESRATDFTESLTREYAKKPSGEATCSVGRPANPADPFQLIGRWAEDAKDRPRERPPEPILVGEQLAYMWGLYRGQVVSMFTATFGEDGRLSESAVTRRYQVVGSFRTEDNEMDSRRVYLAREDLNDVLQHDQGWTSIVVKLRDYERDKDLAREEIGSALHAARYLPKQTERWRAIQTWEDFRSQLLRAIQNEKMLMGIMLSLVLVVACFTVFALLSMMVTEKRRDIGILAALGANSRGILMVFLLIGLWEAIIGSTLGAVAGILGALNIDAIELWLSSTFGFEIFDRTVYLFDHIPSDVTATGVGSIVAGAIFFTLLFAAIPAWRASRLDPVEALRYE